MEDASVVGLAHEPSERAIRPDGEQLKVRHRPGIEDDAVDGRSSATGILQGFTAEHPID
jgi:hypothetical protein